MVAGVGEQAHEQCPGGVGDTGTGQADVQPGERHPYLLLVAGPDD
jgi:hypothetical protein